MKTATLKVRITFIEDVLGSASGNPDVHEEFIAAKAADEHKIREEVEAIKASAALKEAEAIKQSLASGDASPINEVVEEEQQKASTVFPRDEQGIFIWDYQVRGFIKDKVSMLIDLGDITGLSMWAYKKAVDNFVFVTPRKIRLLNPDGSQILEPSGTLQRPLRGETMRGERICLARSEVVPKGSKVEFEIEVLESSNPKSKKAVLGLDDIRSCLDLGTRSGISQWRNGGYGRFTWEEIK